MVKKSEQRRLAAILAADMVGYSRLMEADERGTISRQKSHRAELIDPKIGEHHGRIVKTTGDGMLVEFASVVDAVECAVAIQREMLNRETDIPEDRRIQYRIGINVGDVVDEDGDLLGAGVNVAARLEGLAEPGGICISRTARDQVRDLLDVTLEDMGEVEVKNIARPVRCFSVVLDTLDDAPQNIPMPLDVTLALPTKPSIAVLPFQNMSVDAEQEFFADGMTEDIITGLSQFHSLFVIARNSSFAYKGKSPDVREVARDLGVRYILEGSVRKGGERIRITGQLIDAETGNHLWAERYDRNLEDVFAVQDEVTEAIVAVIAPEISNVERERSHRRPPNNLDAWDLYQRGLAAYYSSTEAEFRSAIELFDRVNEIDPTFAPAFAMTAQARTRYAMHFMPDNRSELLTQAREKSHQGITLDPQDSVCVWSDGRVHSTLGHHDVAISKAEEAVALNPNDAFAHYVLGVVLYSAGKVEEAIPHVDHAMRLSPRDIFLTGMLFHRALILFHLERYKEAFEWARRASLSPNPRSLTFALLTAVLIKLERKGEAQAALKDLLVFAPDMSCVKFQGNPMFGGPEVLKRFIGALREAGLPE